MLEVQQEILNPAAPPCCRGCLNDKPQEGPDHYSQDKQKSDQGYKSQQKPSDVHKTWNTSLSRIGSHQNIANSVGNYLNSKRNDILQYVFSEKKLGLYLHQNRERSANESAGCHAVLLLRVSSQDKLMPSSLAFSSCRFFFDSIPKWAKETSLVSLGKIGNHFPYRSLVIKKTHPHLILPLHEKISTQKITVYTCIIIIQKFNCIHAPRCHQVKSILFGLSATSMLQCFGTLPGNRIVQTPNPFLDNQNPFPKLTILCYHASLTSTNWLSTGGVFVCLVFEQESFPNPKIDHNVS